MALLFSQLRLLLLALGVEVVSGCSRPVATSTALFTAKASQPAAQLSPAGPAAVESATPQPHFKTQFITGANHSYGYEVLVDGRVLIYQPTIPGHPGTDGFKTRREARRVAALVVYKLQHHQMPPSVSGAELDSLKVRR
jgi:hypothetical protein